jgi:hypothetical protein
VLADLERDGYLIIENALDEPALRRLRTAVDRVWQQEAPDGAALYRLAFIGLDDAFIELVARNPALAQERRTCGNARLVGRESQRERHRLKGPARTRMECLPSQVTGQLRVLE